MNSLADDGDGTCTDTKCTFRDALAFGDNGATITFTVTGTIVLMQGELAIRKGAEIAGPGAAQLTIDGAQKSRVFDVAAGAMVEITGLTIKNGIEATGDQSAFGGGIRNSGMLEIGYAVITGNNSEGQEGGGIWNNGQLGITSSTIAGNAAGTGGGIASDNGTVFIINSTITGDTAVVGGGIASSGTLTLVNSTVAGNVALSIAAGIVANGAQSKFVSTIVANNPQGGNCGGPITVDGGYNIEDGTSCGFTAATSLSNTKPGLSPLGLRKNGGPTPTIALQAGGPAVDLIPPGVNGCGAQPLNQDQRLFLRPFGSGCDVGAYELDFSGFFPPINNVRTNPIHPGAGVPIEFTLGGDKGLAIFAAGSPSSAQIACDLSADTGDMLPIDTAGNSGLSYDASTDAYTDVWKTDKSWAGTCRRLFVTFTDGSVRTADFSFTR